jgi:hypothetical protein
MRIYNLAFIIILFSQNFFATSKVSVERIQIFSSDDNPWDWSRKFSSQKTWVEICEAFKKADFEFIDEPRDVSDSYIKDMDYVLAFNLYGVSDEIAHIKRFPFERRLFILWEPITVLPHQYDKGLHLNFHKIFTMDDDLVDNKKYFKFCYPQLVLEMIDPIPFAEKKLCVQISSDKTYAHSNELYSERRKVIDYFEKQMTNDFDFYGTLWKSWQFKNYKGVVKAKKEVLRTYKFAFCYENSKNLNGSISEKIFDCFVAGCVPIYWGVENITKYIPENCFIDRRKFSSTEEVYLFIKNISEVEHAEYIQNIKEFLKSDAAYYFSLDYFIDVLARHLIPNYKREIIFDTDKVTRLNRIDHLS